MESVAKLVGIGEAIVCFVRRWMEMGKGGSGEVILCWLCVICSWLK